MKTTSFVLLFLTSIFIFSSQANEKIIGQKTMEEVSANEDLMREHGVLNRLLLIYQEIAMRIENNMEFPIASLVGSAKIVRSFIEDYHEKLEEEFVFTRFEKAGKLTDLVKILRDQHQAGRSLTDYILSHAKESELKDDIQRLILADYIKLFIRMYRPHEAREDTILFPEFKKLISKEEYDELGEVFEEKENKLFGEDGFNTIISEIVGIEKALNIYDLSQFTPKLKNGH